MWIRDTAKTIVIGAIAIAALTSCAAGSDEEPTKAKLSGSIQTVLSGAGVPPGFPTDATDVHIETDGELVAVKWTGPRMEGCTAAAVGAIPNAAAIALLYQDVGIKNIEQCGDFWQADQVDGTHILWN